MANANGKYTAVASARRLHLDILKTILYWLTWGAVDPYQHVKISILNVQTGKIAKTIDYRDRFDLRDRDLRAIRSALEGQSQEQFERDWIDRDVAENVSPSQAWQMLRMSVAQIFRR